MNYADIRPIDVANGPGIRVSVFVSGCTHACPECFNPEAWDFDYGQPFTQASADTVLEALEPAYIRGLSLLGGEPCHPRNQGAVLDLVRQVRERFLEKDIYKIPVPAELGEAPAYNPRSGKGGHSGKKGGKRRWRK